MRTSSEPPLGADRNNPSPPRWAAPVSLVLITACLGVSVYLTVEHYTGSGSLACPETATVSCAKVTTSAQSRLFGVPVALLGLIFFAAMVPLHLPAAWRSQRRWVGLLRIGLWSAGLLDVAWLVYAELVIVGAICLWCTVIHVLTVALFIISIVALPWPEAGTDLDELDALYDSAAR